MLSRDVAALYYHPKEGGVLELVVIGLTEFLASSKVRNRYPGT
ncbi:hypothetical protein [Clostridium sp.]